MMLSERIEALYTFIPAWFVACMFTVAGISMLMRFYEQRRGHYLPRPWAAVGVSGALLGFGVLYVAVAFGNESFSLAVRAGIVRLLSSLLCAAILHLNFDYIRLALRGDRK